MAKVNVKIAVLIAAANSIQVFDSAQEALAAFEAAEGEAALILNAADMSAEVCKELGLRRKLGVWPWFQKDGEGLRFAEGRAQWYFKTPKMWTMKRGDISQALWRAGFVALMRALGM